MLVASEDDDFDRGTLSGDSVESPNVGDYIDVTFKDVHISKENDQNRIPHMFYAHWR